jgi:hypothetical protein
VLANRRRPPLHVGYLLDERMQRAIRRRLAVGFAVGDQSNFGLTLHFIGAA